MEKDREASVYRVMCSANLVLRVYTASSSCVDVVAVIIKFLPWAKVLAGPHPARLTGTVYFWGHLWASLIRMTIDVRRRWGHVPSRPWGGVPHVGGAPARRGIGWTAVVRGVHRGGQGLLGRPTTVPRWWNSRVWWAMRGAHACPSCSSSTPRPCSAAMGSCRGTGGIEVWAIWTTTGKTILAVTTMGLSAVIEGFTGPGRLEGWQIMQNNIYIQCNAGSLPCHGDSWNISSGTSLQPLVSTTTLIRYRVKGLQPDVNIISLWHLAEKWLQDYYRSNLYHEKTAVMNVF